MRRILFSLTALTGLAAIDAVLAMDVNPSKNNQPPVFWQGGGNKFSIFNGDPKRIQRANAVDAKSFDAKIEVAPDPLSLKVVKGAGTNPGLKVTFSAHNHGKKTYTLSFPSAQRWDFRILNAAGAAIYTYSENCEFEQKVGTSMVNNDDRLVYTETVDLSDLSQPLEPGNYTFEAVLANYPEIHATTQVVVQP